MPRRPTNIQTYLLKEKERQLKFNPGTVEKYQSGFGNTPMLEAKPKYNAAKNERVISGEVNAYITFGKDRPGGLDTGWGAEGRKTGASRIDLVAGLSGITAKEANELGEPIATSPNPSLDSARIYITQQAKDIDSEEYFNLADGKVGKVENESAIAIKADSVRVIGRRGIKIVTGSDKYSGGSGFYVGDDMPGIDLIAGNNDKDLQPMVKGNDLQKAILELHRMNQETFEFIIFILKLQLKHLSITLPNPYMAAALPEIIRTLGKDGVSLVRRVAAHSLSSALFKYNIGAPTDEPAIKVARAFLAPAYDFRSKYNNVN
tara:strand:+ start:2574 stop:3527 length:954 start_codon:yes stop_codon:yes gene_type:complete